MHILIIGLTAFVLFLVMGALFVAAVVAEGRQRRKMIAAGQLAPSEEEPAPFVVEKPKTMAAAAGR